MSNAETQIDLLWYYRFNELNPGNIEMIPEPFDKIIKEDSHLTEQELTIKYPEHFL